MIGVMVMLLVIFPGVDFPKEVEDCRGERRTVPVIGVSLLSVHRLRGLTVSVGLLPES